MYVQSVTFERLKGFKNLHFDFTRPGGGCAGWTVFVGGNASGKSTLLRGIALALMGSDAGRQLMGTTAGWIQDGERRAEVKLNLAFDPKYDSFKTGGTSPRSPFEAGVRWVLETKESVVPEFRAIEKRNEKDTRIKSPERGPWSPNAKGWFSAGYGPMRRLSGSSSESSSFAARGGVVSRFVTLFREDAALSESETWLKTNHSRSLESGGEDIKKLLEGVKELLSDDLLPHDMKLTRVTVDHVFICDNRGLELPMRDISDGCRSVYATILDLVHGMFEIYGINGLFKKENNRVIIDRPGVVLIDEIEAHLHPAWQRDIPEWLKVHFPQVQFLISTHSPLVAQAADQNGIFVLPSQTDLNQEPRRLEDEEFEKIRMGRAEKTLLGAAFGLKSVRSRWANLQIERWKQLNAKAKAGAPLDMKEKRDLDQVGKQLRLAFEPVQELETP